MISLLTGIDSTASALDAERVRMDVISENIANVNTTRDLDGKPYQRREVVFENVLKAQQDSIGGGAEAVRIARIQKDARPPRMIYNPGHPDANAQGYVTYPNVNVVTEMVNLMTASRAYEAGVTSIESLKTMAKTAIKIGQ